MFSDLDGIWKIMDFDSSIEASSAKADFTRRAGTKGYIAPECAERGEYSESSDVFSLGSVLFDVLFPKFYRYLDEDASYCKYFDEFELLVLKMNDPIVYSRSSLKNALTSLFLLLKKILPRDSYIFKDKLFCDVQNLLNKQINIEKSTEIIHTKFPLKSAKDLQEMEPSALVIENILAHQAQM